MDRRSFISKAGVGAAVASTTALSAPAIAQGKRTLTMVTSVPHGFAVFDSAAVYFANAVTEMTDGQITIEKKAAGELVGAFEVFDAVSSGQADIYHSADYYFGGQHPACITSHPCRLARLLKNSWLGTTTAVDTISTTSLVKSST